MQMPKEEAVWLGEHAELRNQVFVCKKTGVEIKTAMVSRSIWISRSFPGGTGKVRLILHVACLACTPGATPPREGEPIYLDEIVEAGISLY